MLALRWIVRALYAALVRASLGLRSRPCWRIFWSITMRPVSRSGVNKSSSARSFRKKVATSNMANHISPMRGGWRL